MKFYKRHRCPAQMRLQIINGGVELLNLSSEEMALIAKYGGDGTGKIDLLEQLRFDPDSLLELVVSYEPKIRT